MNQHKAIAAVTMTLRKVLETGRKNGPPGLSGVVMHKPPGLIRDFPVVDAVNLFLYDTTVNAAWRNMDLPDRVKSGETGHPPLALNLHYLLTAYADETTRPRSHELLGQAMAILHDSPLLNADEIQYDDGVDYTHQQIERVRITPQVLSLDEMTKLWSTFQQDYRISTAYQVNVVLIESSRPIKTPLPVRRRGREDSDGAGGTLPETPERIGTQSDALPPFPTILSIEPAGGQPSVELATVAELAAQPQQPSLVVKGHNLAAKTGEEVELQFTHPYLANDTKPIPIAIPATDRSDNQIRAVLPADLKVPPGLSRLALAFTTGSDDAKTVVRSSSQIPTSIAARIDFEADPQIPSGVPQVAGEMQEVTTDEGAVNKVVIAVKFNPAVRTNKQEIALLLGSESIAFDQNLTDRFPGKSSLTVNGVYSFNGQEAQVEITTPLPIPALAEVLVFIVDPPPADGWPINELVRLRIDGIDSLLVADRTAKPPRFRDTRVIVPRPGS